MDRIDTMKAFTAVVKEGSFTKAADKLGLSSQLVSKYVSTVLGAYQAQQYQAVQNRAERASAVRYYSQL